MTTIEYFSLVYALLRAVSSHDSNNPTWWIPHGVIQSTIKYFVFGLNSCGAQKNNTYFQLRT